MADLDVLQLGGATGALARATQLANMKASNAANRVASLMRQSRPNAARPPRRRLPPPGPLTRPPAAGERPPSFPGSDPQALYDQPPDLLDAFDRLNSSRPQPPKPTGPMLGPPMPPKKPDWTDAFLETAATPGAPIPPAPPPQSHAASKGMQQEVEEQSQKRRGTITGLIQDIERDPTMTPDKLRVAKEVVAFYKDSTKNRLLSEDELYENPIFRTLQEQSVWSQYRRKVADYKARKTKVQGDETEGGDGTFSDMLAEDRTLSQALNSGNLPPFMVTRDEKGFLQVVTADQWKDAKYTQMQKDPAYAAQMITALAMTSLYGSDSAANAQASRVSLDKDGNPVKAIAGEEDEKALGALAKMVAIAQNQGETDTPDDYLALIAAQGRDISDTNKANGEFGGGGGGGFGGGGGGFGGGGGGGQSVRLSDPTALGAMADSISRQRMGRSLTPAEQAAFVQYYHQLEQASSAAWASGGQYTPPDMEGQAVDWVTKHYQGEADANQYGNLAAQFFALMGSGNPFGMIAS
jgi:hypothetical protein